ncbi:MAG: radical SAM protein [Chloroflexota bacterium]
MLGVSRLLCGTTTETDHLRYGDRRQQSGDGVPRPVVVWTTTRRCNLACLHCYAAAADRPFPGELSPAEGRAFIADLGQFGVPVLLLSGGEPLLRPDLFELAAYAHENGIRTTLSTNGTRITPEVAQRIKDVGFGYVGISLDGIGQRHDYFRGQDGAFDAALDGIRNCVAVGQRVGLRLTLTRHTVQDLDAIFDLIEREQINRACFYHLVPSGRGRQIAADLLAPDEARAAVERIFEQAQSFHRRGLNTELLTVDNHSDGVLLYLKVLREDGPVRAAEVLSLLRRNGGNSSGARLAHVDNLGNVHPDQFWWRQRLGNVRERPFSAIWSDPDNALLHDLRNRRDVLQGRCGRCQFVDICNGNFRARAEAMTGNTWAEDPGCYLTDREIAPLEAVHA